MKPCDEWRDVLVGWCVLPHNGVDYCGGEYRATGKAPAGSKWPAIKSMQDCPWKDSARKGWKHKVVGA